MSVESAASASSSPSKVSRRIWNSIVRRKKQLNDPREWRHHFTEFFYCSFFLQSNSLLLLLETTLSIDSLRRTGFVQVPSSRFDFDCFQHLFTEFYRVLPSFGST